MYKFDQWSIPDPSVFHLIDATNNKFQIESDICQMYKTKVSGCMFACSIFSSSNGSTTLGSAMTKDF